jgi:hypothetical protein
LNAILSAAPELGRFGSALVVNGAEHPKTALDNGGPGSVD